MAHSEQGCDSQSPLTSTSKWVYKRVKFDKIKMILKVILILIQLKDVAHGTSAPVDERWLSY